MQGGWVEEHGCGSWLWKMGTFRQVAGEEELPMPALVCQRQKKRTFGRSFSSVTLIAAVVCLPKLSLFIYRTVPHNELSNVLWTVNFPNAVVSFLYTCLQHTHTHNPETPLKSLFPENSLGFIQYWSIKALPLFERSEWRKYVFYDALASFLRMWWKATQLLSPINQVETHNAVYKLSSLSKVAEHVNLL